MGRASSFSLAFCFLAFAVVSHCAGESPMEEEQVVMLQEGATPKAATIKNAMKSIPKSILALAAGKKAVHAGATVPKKRVPSTVQAVHSLVAETAAKVQATMAKPEAAPRIRMPAIRPPKSIQPQEPPAPSLASFATQHVKVPEVQLKVKASPALVAMQKLLHQHHVPIPSKVVPKVKEAAVTPKSKASRPTPKVRMGETALSTAERLRAAVKGEMKHSISLKDTKVRTKKLVTNSLGVIDGSNNSWQPFENKVPKHALNPKRTFLPVTQQAFRAQKFQTPTVDSIVKSLHAAEAQNAQQQTAIMKPSKTIDVKALDYGEDETLLKPTKSKGDSLAWPFGKPDFENLLQSTSSRGAGDTDADENQKDKDDDDDKDDEDDEDDEDDKDEDDDRGDLGESRSADGQQPSPAALPAGEHEPIIHYDPVQDMLQANGWSPSVLNKQPPTPVVPNSQAAAPSDVDTTNSDDDDNDDDDKDEETDEDEEDEESQDLGESQDLDDDDTNEGELPSPPQTPSQSTSMASTKAEEAQSSKTDAEDNNELHGDLGESASTDSGEDRSQEHSVPLDAPSRDPESKDNRGHQGNSKHNIDAADETDDADDSELMSAGDDTSDMDTP